MFNKRYDGRQIKTLNPFYKMVPYLMKDRSDAQVFYEDKIAIDNLEEYIKAKKDEGIVLSHMEIVIAAMARVALERPALNRFVMNRKIYSRKKITVSLAIKKTLDDEATETTVKFDIAPTDTVFDISKQIREVLEENKKITTSNNVDKLVEKIMNLPNFFIKSVVWILMWMDEHNMMPRAIIEASPMHTSFFITNMGSLGIDSIYHHIYNFGTTSIFLAMGGKKEEINPSTGLAEKYISFKFVNDERICDGLYYARSFALFRRYIANPERLEKTCETVKEDIK